MSRRGTTSAPLATTAGPLAHGLDVLDPLFQQMRARGLAPREVRERILKALKREELIILAHVAAGAWSLQPRQFATREEEAQAEQEARAATERYDFDAYYRIVFEQSPSPDGIIGPIEPENWEVMVTIAIRDGHLVIKPLAPEFPVESYSFAIATPEAVDKLLAAASPAHTSYSTTDDRASSESTTKSPRPGTAGYWIDVVAPRGAWRNLTAKRLHSVAAKHIDGLNVENEREAKKQSQRLPPKINCPGARAFQTEVANRHRRER